MRVSQQQLNMGAGLPVEVAVPAAPHRATH
jgi:hypothetical protein